MEFLKLAIEAAETAGEILKRDFSMRPVIEAKGKHDIVTSTDQHSEKTILTILQSYFPGHNYIAEESGTVHTSSEYCWYIDPLDGTSHFVSGNPYFSVSIALAIENELQVAVVYNPILNELYTSEKGKGAFLNHTPISVNSTNRLSDAIIATAFSAREEKLEQGLHSIGILARHTRKLIINFSPAMDLCNIARGRLDGLVTAGTTPEDHAAGSLILKEAGGKVENFDNERWDVSEEGILASNGVIQKSMAALLR